MKFFFMYFMLFMVKNSISINELIFMQMFST